LLGGLARTRWPAPVRHQAEMPGARRGGEGARSLRADSGLSEDSSDNEGACCSHKEGGHDDAADFPPGLAPRRCTDVLCLLLFFGALGSLGLVWQYSLEHGDLRRLYHGYDFLGELCGVGDKADTPVLYWCRDPSDPTGLKLDLAHPMCRAGCPTGSDTSTACYTGMTRGPKEFIDSLESFTVKSTYKFENVQDYNSYALMGIYCIPQEQVLLEQITGWFKDDIASKVLLSAASLANAWPVLLGCAGAAVLLGLVGLCVLDRMAGCVVYSSMAVLVITPMVLGGALVYGGLTEAERSALGAQLSAAEAAALGGEGLELAALAEPLGGLYAWASPEWRTGIGAGLGALGLLLLLLFCCCQRSVRVAVAVVRASSECFLDLPTLALQPLLAMVFQLGVVAAMAAGFLLLLSSGEVTPLSLEDYTVYASLSGSSNVSGVFRSFKYGEDELYLIAFYVFMMFWVCEAVNATSQFVLAHAVQHWYFTPYEGGRKEDVDCFPLAKGYTVGIFFHVGSFAFGSFIIAATRVVRIVLSFLAKQARGEGNVVGEVAANCCMCVVSCFQRSMEFLNKNAYMDIAVNSSNFCSGARRALSILVHNVPEVGVLNGACWIIQFAGVGAITVSGTGVIYVALRQVDQFSDPTSEWYVQDTVPVLVAAGLISFAVGHAFMNVFDMVSDTILYCKCTEELRRRQGTLDPGEQYAPDSLDALIRDECPTLRKR